MAIILQETKDGFERFQGAANLSATKVAALVDDGVWTEKDLATHGLTLAEAATIPEDEAVNSLERFEVVKGTVRQVFDTVPVVEMRRKSDVVREMTDEEAEAFFGAMTVKERALWFSPDEPMIATDDLRLEMSDPGVETGGLK